MLVAEKFGHPRRSSRAFALQALYEVDVAAHPVENAVRWLHEQTSPSEEALPFALKLIAGVLEHRPHLDELIQKFAPAWPVRHLPAVDRNILRLALYEVNFEKGVPHKAAINEAVELAKSFGSESSGRFVNGVLGTAMEQLDTGPEPALGKAIGTDGKTEAR